ncbi:glycosyltransferase [Oryzobacter terrae]|uniref:glycosyltransferase n=1 Tax=Oryzobacter terrae TaxID=1620385 RepID=UPI00366C24FC
MRAPTLRRPTNAAFAVPVHAAIATSVVIPTRNEAGNVAELLRRLVPQLPLGSEIIFVDDSDDRTVDAVRRAGESARVAVRIHHREPAERGDGLGGAVAAGLRAATCAWVVVMDADLQHPPELVPRLVQVGEENRSDLVVASRYSGSGDADSFSRGRAMMSTWATRLTKAFFPRRLAKVSDPMSGFFAVRREAVDVDALRPNGFKILLEIAVRCGPLRISEVSFHFGQRFAGASKAGLRECLRLVVLLLRLWFDAAAGRRSRMAGFAAIGATGIVVNTVAMWLASGVGGLHYALGAVLATVVSTVWNWAALEAVVYPGAARSSTARRFAGFGALNALALVLRVPLIALLVEALGVNYLVANLVSIAALFVARFAVSDSLIFRRAPSGINVPAPDPVVVTVSDGLPVVEADPGLTVPVLAPRRAHEGYLKYRYLVPGVATIGSEVPLPELQWFLTPFVTRGPFDVEIRVGAVGRPRGHVRFTANTADERTYEEHLGALSANFRIEMGDTIHVTAGRLLERSPHVLYTNVIEALLRFLAVSRGRLLLHSACVRLDGTGVMLSARTDTGKTGTILRLIREQGATFLSDDMTILHPNGIAHCYPKPLTISHHTLRAVDARGLSRTQWGKLRVQSRLHSKEGRQFGMRLSQMNLPIMTFNALTQAVVPPPKFDVDRLVPCDVVHEVPVSTLFIIERGENLIEDVSHDLALQELIENTDDAYGFPPFSILAPTLRIGGMDYQELRSRERELLSTVLDKIRVRRLVRDDFGWPAEIRSLMARDRADRALASPVVDLDSLPALVTVATTAGVGDGLLAANGNGSGRHNGNGNGHGGHLEGIGLGVSGLPEGWRDIGPPRAGETPA